jgi:alkaline phosphatase D
MLDTRRYRTDGQKTSVTPHTMLGDKQLAALYQWLVKVSFSFMPSRNTTIEMLREQANATATFKFLVTSVPFTSLWHTPDASDSWAGYLAEREALLSVMHTIPNLIIISGDRHEAAIVEFAPSSEDGRTLLEVSSSPLSQMISPFFGWSLKKASKETVMRVREELLVTEDGEEVVMSIEKEVPRERLIKGIALGNYKWCVSVGFCCEPGMC